MGSLLLGGNLPRLRTSYVCLWFLALSAFVFSDFLLFGKILIGNLDVADINLPNLITAKRSFVNGEWGLWNPYLISGTSAFSNAIAPQFYPENWLLFWLPETTFFWAITLVSFLKLWGIGFFSFLWLRLEVRHAGWALLAATVYQLCGFSLWTVISSDSISLQFYFTLTCYLLWSAEERPAWRNYLWLTLALAQVFYCSNYVYSAYVLAMTAGLFLYRLSTEGTRPFRFPSWSPFALALFTTGLLAMPRWWPSWVELSHSNRSTEPFFHEVAEFPFLAVRLFIPEAFGINYWSSFNTIGELSSVFKTLSIQIFAYFPHYFGVVSVLLALWGLKFVRSDRRLAFLYASVGVPLILLMAVEPLNTLLRELMYPFFHIQSVHFLLAPAFCLLLAHVGKRLEEDKPDERPWWIVGACFMAVVYAAVTWSLNFQGEWNVSLVIKGICLLAAVAFFSRRSLNARIWLGALLAGSVFLLAVTESPNQIHLSHVRILSVSIALLSVYGFLAHRKKNTALGVLVALSAIFALIFGVRNEVFILATREQTFAVALLGVAKFALLAGLFFSLCRRLKAEQPAFLVGCFGLLVLELLPAAKIHTHLVMNPFFDAATPYPALTAKVPLSLEDYRVNYPNTFAATPLYRAMYNGNEVLSAMHATYGIRSYGGYVNSVPGRYARLVENFLPPGMGEKIIDRGKHGYVATLTEPRFLDLVGVGYDFDPKDGTLQRRPNALSRFMFFDAFEIISSEARSLSRLKEEAFDPKQQLILEKSPGFAPRVPGPSQFLPYKAKGTDHLELEVKAPTPGIVLFNDSYHSGWRVKVNGQSQELLRANYGFMAVAVRPGKNLIELDFLPAAFTEGVRMARWGVALFFFSLFLQIGSSYLFAGARPRRREQPA